MNPISRSIQRDYPRYLFLFCSLLAVELLSPRCFADTTIATDLIDMESGTVGSAVTAQNATNSTTGGTTGTSGTWRYKVSAPTTLTTSNAHVRPARGPVQIVGGALLSDSGSTK